MGCGGRKLEGYGDVTPPCPHSPPLGVESSGECGENVQEYWGQTRTSGVGGTPLQTELGRTTWWL